MKLLILDVLQKLRTCCWSGRSGHCRHSMSVITPAQTQPVQVSAPQSFFLKLVEQTNFGNLQPKPLLPYGTEPGAENHFGASVSQNTVLVSAVSLSLGAFYFSSSTVLPKYSFWNCWNSSSENRDLVSFAFLVGRSGRFLDCLPVLWFRIFMVSESLAL